MSCARAEAYSNQYQATVDATTKAAEAVPEDKRLNQVADGKAHPLWLMGHLAMSFDLLTNSWMMGRALEIPSDWASIFGPSQFGGRAITNNPDDYPAWDDVIAAYKKAGAAAVEGVAKLSDDQLEGWPFGDIPDQFKEAFGMMNQAIPDNAAHDSYHRGQMSLLAALD